MTRALILALDGGQSSTKAVIADVDGHVLARGTGSPCDHLSGPHGYERNRAALHSATRSALDVGGIDPADIVAVGMGLTSCPPEINAQPTFEEMIREIVAPDAVWIKHDAASNLAGASAGQPGVVVIGGGGSIGYGETADGRWAKCGGLGYLLGDEGSAWWIGLSALQAAAKSVDGRGPETALLPYILGRYQLPTIRHIYRVIYADGFTRDQVSALAPDVARLAPDDIVANEIIRLAGRKLAELAIGTIHQLHEPDDEVDVYPTGGVFAAGPLLNDAFSSALQDACPSATVRAPLLPPVYGAWLRALGALGVTQTPEILANLRASVP